MSMGSLRFLGLAGPTTRRAFRPEGPTCLQLQLVCKKDLVPRLGKWTVDPAFSNNWGFDTTLGLRHHVAIYYVLWIVLAGAVVQVVLNLARAINYMGLGLEVTTCLLPRLLFLVLL